MRFALLILSLCLLSLSPQVAADCHTPTWSCISSPVPLPNEQNQDSKDAWELSAGNATVEITVESPDEKQANQAVAGSSVTPGSLFQFVARVSLPESAGAADRYALKFDAPFGIDFEGSDLWSFRLEPGQIREAKFSFTPSSKVFAQHIHLSAAFGAFASPDDPHGEIDSVSITLDIGSLAGIANAPGLGLVAAVATLTGLALLRRRF